MGEEPGRAAGAARHIDAGHRAACGGQRAAPHSEGARGPCGAGAAEIRQTLLIPVSVVVVAAVQAIPTDSDSGEQVDGAQGVVNLLQEPVRASSSSVLGMSRGALRLAVERRYLLYSSQRGSIVDRLAQHFAAHGVRERLDGALLRERLSVLLAPAAAASGSTSLFTDSSGSGAGASLEVVGEWGRLRQELDKALSRLEGSFPSGCTPAFEGFLAGCALSAVLRVLKN
jgi:hypothetical protein